VLGLLNAKVGYLRGFGASLLSLESQRGFRGFAAGLLLHRSRGPAAGASAALLLNRQGSESAESRGFQAALGYALTLGSLQGAQAALVARAKGQLSGAQFGLVSLSEGRVEGLQVGLVNAAGEGVRGLQLGLVNQAHGPARGLQLGLVNSARGGQTQIGLVNASKGKGARIGLVNVGHGVRPQLLLWASNSGLSIDAEWAGGFLGHVGLRTLTGGLLSMLSVGVGPGGCFPAQTACSGQQLRVAPGLTLGGRVSLSRQVKMEIDAQYRYSFETDDFLVGAHSLGPRISFTLEPTPAFGFFVGGGAEGTWTPEADSVWLMEQLFAGVSFF
jgi:hypothetical protein